MPPQKLIYSAIASGSSVSSDVDLAFGTRLWAIAVPSITSADLLVQGGFDTTSANFLRILDTRGQGSGDLRFATGPGSRMILWPQDVPCPTKLRLETGVAQAAPVSSIQLLVR
jgi:hypothetical protein